MYGLPPDIDLGFFLQKLLVQICFGGTDLHLNFETCSVLITSRIAIVTSDGRREIFNDYRLAAPTLFPFLNVAVDSVKGTTDGTLYLGFSEKGFIEIYDGSQQFESYVIRRLGEKEIVV